MQCSADHSHKNEGANSFWHQLTTSAGVSNNGAAMTIYMTNLIQGNNLNAIEPIIKKAILNNINNALFLAKGRVNSSIPVNVSAKITLIIFLYVI